MRPKENQRKEKILLLLLCGDVTGKEKSALETGRESRWTGGKMKIGAVGVWSRNGGETRGLLGDGTIDAFTSSSKGPSEKRLRTGLI